MKPAQPVERQPLLDTPRALAYTRATSFPGPEIPCAGAGDAAAVAGGGVV